MWDNIKTIADEQEHVSKYVFTKENAVSEAVLYRYPTYNERTVICCSTQSGCPVGCRFCGSGDFFVRSLSVEEIVSQPVRCIEDIDCAVEDIGRLQIMFMSMGEPLLNLKNLCPAIEQLHTLYPNAWLLISTSAPRVNYDEVIEISKKVPKVGLQFSVHESTDEARDKLIPFKNKLTLQEISEQGERWFKEVGRKPFFNYCAHAGNSTDADAERILQLLDPTIWCATVSVICERGEGMKARNDYQKSLAEDFANKLFSMGYDTRMFDPAGQDTIGGGCGQLWFVQEWAKNNSQHVKPSIGNGLPEVHTPAAA